MKRPRRDYFFGAVTARYLFSDGTGAVSLVLLPGSKTDDAQIAAAKLANADCIMVLDHGRIMERVTHDHLIAQKGAYDPLYTGAFELE